MSYPLPYNSGMDIVDPQQLIRGFRRVDISIANPAELRGVLDDIRCVRARFDHVEAEVARRLQTTSATPERDVATSAQRSNRHGSKVMARAAALAESPALSKALDAGELGGEHVDTFAKVLSSVDGAVKSELRAAAPELIKVAAASGSTPEEFALSLHAAAEQIAADGGMERLERQRRATRLRTWTDRTTGMWRISGAFDPESGARIHGRIEAAMAAMFAVKTPSTAPTDPGEKQDHLRAVALLALTAGFGYGANEAQYGGTDNPESRPNGALFQSDPSGRSEAQARSGHFDSPEDPGSLRDPGESERLGSGDEWARFAEGFAAATKRFGRPEFTVVIDTTVLGPDGNPTIDWGIPIRVPWSRIKDLCRDAAIRPVIVRDGAVLDAEGELNLGRTTRLANRAQRRALRALYATCAVPGCNVSFHHTKPHHVHWWRHGGPTDLANLLPLCSKHHHAAHEGGWRFTLSPNRALRIELPNGEVMETGPPRREGKAA